MTNTNNLAFLLENVENGDRKITNQTFIGESLSNQNNVASGWIFIEVGFKNCTFENYDLVHTAFSQCDFQDCRFIGANLRELEAYECRFEKSTFIKSRFADADISQTMFSSCSFEEANFQQAYLNDCQFVDSQFRNIDTRGFPALLQDSKIINMGQAIPLQGGFDFDKVLAFLNSDP